ncbi:UDP-N-acetylmuramoyl-L-alanine--D-glutamate ligase [Kushneria aurantia]|uniref:UDP-N-acetylmuramoylalanine--D-glutamate ligase n=1 Tax=Kushneria aurantia TaxID=504092 RepID=A0ABV6FZY1_9GAMM|nr:UDP-N-acetylmuramoyl-L-alanine--D-glutamate ligase [Kushneria aurantia]
MTIVTAEQTLVVGLGRSGLAIAAHLSARGEPFVMADTRAEPPGEAAFRAAYPQVTLHCGPLTAIDLRYARRVVLSPGVDPRSPGLEQAAAPPVGEIALFVEALTALPSRPQLIAVTGSNAKSTVTTLIGELATACGVDAAVGGNLGTPALTLVHQRPEADCFVLELSSFQLETTPRLGADIALHLNLSDDHLDRHDGMAGYARAKQRIFEGAGTAIHNRDDPATRPQTADIARLVSFGADAPAAGQWGLGERDGAPWLCQGDAALLAAERVRMPGRHNRLNALAALAAGREAGWPLAPMLDVLAEFSGLAHRAQLIAERGGVCWINDSKGTNVGATLAAIEGVGATLAGRLILLAGGVGKGADFSALAAPLARYARAVVLFGRDRHLLEAALSAQVTTHVVDTLDQAMQHADELARPGDGVLLSPACASLDQFANFEARGEAFCAWLEQHPESSCKR